MTKQKPRRGGEKDEPSTPVGVASLTTTKESCDAGTMIHRPDKDPEQTDVAREERRPPDFELGQLVATPGALEALTHGDILKSLQRHLAGDWGDVDEEDRAANDRALIEGSRLLSSYKSESGVKFWIITEADRSATTVLLPSEY